MLPSYIVTTWEYCNGEKPQDHIKKEVYPQSNLTANIPDPAPHTAHYTTKHTKPTINTNVPVTVLHTVTLYDIIYATNTYH